MTKINNQKGFSLVQAIFILVVLALLGTYMVRLSTVGQATSTQTLLQARAYQAARAGLEWEIAQVVNAGSCANATFDVDGYTVAATCILSGNYTEASSTYGVYQLKSSATFADIASPDYVSRTLEVTIHD